MAIRFIFAGMGKVPVSGLKSVMAILMVGLVSLVTFAKTPATRPELSDDPAVLKGVILEKEQEIESLKAQIAKLMPTVAANAPTTQKHNAYPSIGGVWQEAPGRPVTVTQTNGDWKAQCTYTTPEAQEVQWEMRGTITTDGKMKGFLRFIRAPAKWAEMQSRQSELSKDGNTISGVAKWANVSQAFTWTRGDAIPKKPVAPKIGDSEDDLAAYAKAWHYFLSVRSETVNSKIVEMVYVNPGSVGIPGIPNSASDPSSTSAGIFYIEDHKIVRIDH